VKRDNQDDSEKGAKNITPVTVQSKVKLMVFGEKVCYKLVAVISHDGPSWNAGSYPKTKFKKKMYILITISKGYFYADVVKDNNWFTISNTSVLMTDFEEIADRVQSLCDVLLYEMQGKEIFITQ